MRVYHASAEAIPCPDIRHGRKNADFGQEFYVTGDADFAARWARGGPDGRAVLNCYELELEGLDCVSLSRDEAWFDYIFANRAAKAERYPRADVIMGPIANDTLYETYGIITSGYLSRETATRLLQIGPEFMQLALKSDRAKAALTFLEAKPISAQEIRSKAEQVKKEQEAYQAAFARVLEECRKEGESP